MSKNSILIKRRESFGLQYFQNDVPFFMIFPLLEFWFHFIEHIFSKLISLGLAQIKLQEQWLLLMVSVRLTIKLDFFGPRFVKSIWRLLFSVNLMASLASPCRLGARQCSDFQEAPFLSPPRKLRWIITKLTSSRNISIFLWMVLKKWPKKL